MSALAGSAPQGLWLVRIETGPVIRLHSGFGDFEAPANALDAEAQIYSGLSAVTDLPGLELMLNGAASRTVLSLSGVSQAVADLAASEAPDVQGCAVNFGLQMLDDELQPSGDTLWLYDAVGDVVRTSVTAGGDASQNSAISLSVGSAMTPRKRPDYDSWTDAQHQRAHPSDLFFNQVPSGETTKVWPGG